MADDHDVPMGTDLRIVDDPRGLVRGAPLHFTFDGADVSAFEGETVGAALLAQGTRATRLTRGTGAPRGLFCGVGSCHDCLVSVDGSGPLRACLVPVTEGARVTTYWTEGTP
jgi:aerobic-type carbon monoxide dehydrogenase small subunit (CoxS/CutS family)